MQRGRRATERASRVHSTRQLLVALSSRPRLRREGVPRLQAASVSTFTIFQVILYSFMLKI